MIPSIHVLYVLQKLLGVGESLEVSSVVKGLCEVHDDLNKKYIARICDTMTELFTGKKRYNGCVHLHFCSSLSLSVSLPYRVPLIFIYSLTAEYCQTIINSLESLNPG